MERWPKKTMQEEMSSDPPVKWRLCLVWTLALCQGTLISLADPQPVLEDLNWGIAQTELCREVLFGDVQSLRRDGGQGLAVALRVLDSAGLERHVSLIRKGDDPLQVFAVAIVDLSLSEQLAAIHAKDPTIQPRNACKKVKTKIVKEVATVELDEALSELGSLCISPVITAPFVPHGEHYEIWVFSAGTASHFDFGGVPSDSAEDNILQAWSSRVLNQVWSKK